MLRAALGVSVGWLAISMVADAVPALLLPHQLLADGSHSATRLGLITLVAIGIGVVLQPVAGSVSDRVGRLPVIGFGTIMAVAGLALLVAPEGAVPGTIVTLAGVSVAQAGQQALLPDRIDRGWRGRAGGLKSAFDVAGAFAGFVVLAALLASGEALLASAALAVALATGACLTVALLGASPNPSSPAPAPSRAQPVAPSLAKLVAARFLFLLGIYAVGRFLLLFVADRFDLGADAAGGQAGAVLAILALATVAASIPSGWLSDRLGRRPMMLAGGAVAAIGIWLLPMAGSLEALLGVGCLMAVGSAAFGSASWAMLADLSPSPRSGRLMGLANIGTAGAAAVAGLFGFVVDVGGFGTAFALAAASSLAGGALAWTLGDVRGSSAVLVGSTGGAR